MREFYLLFCNYLSKEKTYNLSTNFHKLMSFPREENVKKDEKDLKKVNIKFTIKAGAKGKGNNKSVSFKLVKFYQKWLQMSFNDLIFEVVQKWDIAGIPQR